MIGYDEDGAMGYIMLNYSDYEVNIINNLFKATCVDDIPESIIDEFFKIHDNDVVYLRL